MRYKVRTLLLLPVACTAGLVCSRAPVSHWSGAKPVNLPILVVDRISGRPMPNAEVELIQPYDDERPPVKARTGPDGRVVLRNLFHACGSDYVIGGSESVTFSPWLIRVAAPGARPFCAALAPPASEPSVRETGPCLNLSYPVSGPVRIALDRSNAAPRNGE